MPLLYTTCLGVGPVRSDAICTLAMGADRYNRLNQVRTCFTFNVSLNRPPGRWYVMQLHETPTFPSNLSIRQVSVPGREEVKGLSGITSNIDLVLISSTVLSKLSVVPAVYSNSRDAWTSCFKWHALSWTYILEWWPRLEPDFWLGHTTSVRHFVSLETAASNMK